jgi:hypothetical protein
MGIIKFIFFTKMVTAASLRHISSNKKEPISCVAAGFVAIPGNDKVIAMPPE